MSDRIRHATCITLRLGGRLAGVGWSRFPSGPGVFCPRSAHSTADPLGGLVRLASRRRRLGAARGGVG